MHSRQLFTTLPSPQYSATITNGSFLLFRCTTTPFVLPRSLIRFDPPPRNHISSSPLDPCDSKPSLFPSAVFCPRIRIVSLPTSPPVFSQKLDLVPAPPPSFAERTARLLLATHYFTLFSEREDGN
ncbi:hypothetical protein BDY21DRAFT_189374 [Lineolata rhizophorae]|uniref:Uncharacterized protein n=1 Tax=Lineolata rhizophorae TaxID=578093 RepID=A0A6A6P6D4_9PEZI|nr:hypothetical protein BDY21DRAFT_189374 [Lineolata rhizophorae]